MQSSRRTEIDVAKGFTLFLVVFGHLLPLNTTLFRWIFSFHMPAFFFLSGMTFRPEKYNGVRDYMQDKARKLLVPYAVITLIGLAICLIRPAYRAEAFQQDCTVYYDLKWILYYGQPMQLYIGQVWFLLALFWAELFSLLWIRVFGQRSVLAKCYSLLILAVAAVHIRSLFPYLPIGERLPWKLDTALGATVFVIAGYYTRRYEVLERLKPYALFLIPVSIWCSYYLGPEMYTYINVCDCFYTAAPYFYPGAFFGILALTLTARLMRGWRFWQYCGRYSMLMFAAHTFVTYWLAEAYTAFTGTVLKPMELMPGDKFCLAFAAAVFAALCVMVLPWHVYKKQRALS